MTRYHLPVPSKCDPLSSLLPEVKIQYGFGLSQMCVLTLYPETEATAQLSLIQESACEVVLTLNMLGIAAV